MALNLLDFETLAMPVKKQGLVQAITNESIFLPLLRFVPVDGFAYHYNRQQALGGIAFRGLNDTYTADTGAVNPQIETLAIMGGTVQTDRQIVNKQGDIARANSVAAKLKKAGLFFDKYVIKGDPTVDPLQFYGLNARLTGAQVLSGGTNGGALTLALLDQALDAVLGSNEKKKIVCNKAIRREITALLRSTAGGLTRSDVPGQAKDYDGAEILLLDEDGDEAPILAFNETQGSSNVTTSLYVIRPGSDVDGEYLQGLTGSKIIEHVPQNLVGTQYLDLIEGNLGIGLFHARAACRIKGLL